MTGTLRHPIRARLEYALALTAFAVLPRLPRGIITRLAYFLGSAGFLFSRKLRRIGLANLDVAFGKSRSPSEKQCILKHSFQSFSLVMLDTFWFSRRSAERIKRHVRFSPAFDALFQAKPHVCFTAHYGNWEVMGMSVTARGWPLHSVAKTLKNPWVDRLFIEARRSTGQQIIKREGAIRAMLRILQDGGKIALVLDQNTREKHGGQFFPFFGLPVLVATAPAAMAIKTKTDVFIGMMTPQPDGSYLGDFGKEIPIAPFLDMPPAEGADALTAKITGELEEFLRHQPDHWLWTYKRWKYIPSGAEREGYPPYAAPSW